MNTVWMWIVGGFRSLVYFLDEVVYGFVIDLYNIFRWICGARVVDNSFMNELATRIGFILGLVMFFYISFDFIQILLDPDKLSDKDKGPLNIIKKFLVVIVLLGTSRYIFDLMYNFQSIVLSNNDGRGSIIEKLILPYDIQTENFGYALSSQLFVQFYRVNDGVELTEGNKGTKMDDYTYEECEDFVDMLHDSVAQSGNFSIGKECLNEKTTIQSGYGNNRSVKEWFIDFSILSLPIGIFVAWMLIMYCISVGMRVIQLVVLQIISPAVIICYLSPKKENTFTKWLKMYFATYVDVFIRIAIIDFVVLLSGLILETNNISSDSGVVATSGMKFWIQVFMIMALLSFAKKAPELLKKLLPESLQSNLSFGISSKDRTGLGILGGALAGTATGVVGGFAGGKGFSKITGAISGALGGAGRGFGAGAKGNNLRESLSNARKNQAQANLNRAQRIAAGTTLSERAGDFAKGMFGIQGGYSGVDSKLSAYDTLNSLVDGEDIVKDYEIQRTKANEDLGKAQREFDRIKSAYSSGNATKAQFDAAQISLDVAQDAYSKADARKSAAREAVWKANMTGQNVNQIEVKWVDHNGNEIEESERAITEAGQNASIKAGMENVTRVSGKKYDSRKAFNTDRKRLQGESNRFHKNGH